MARAPKSMSENECMLATFLNMDVMRPVRKSHSSWNTSNAAAPTGGGNNQPAAVAAIEDSEEQQEMMEEAARRAVFNRKMMSVIPQLGEIAPIVGLCEVLEVTSTGRQPKTEEKSEWRSATKLPAESRLLGALKLTLNRWANTPKDSHSDGARSHLCWGNNG
eukprot:scaffold7476_cov68-Cylindrotheca_fusiformis.AAC.1